MWHTGDGMGWWMGWGGLMMVLFWGGIIAIIVWTVQTLTRREDGQGQPDAPRRAALDIARERYARGEITREEFEQIKRGLEGA